ncbi:tRNA dihydrouridine synthase DusB [Thermoanaerobacterium sp. RBIITD]|uniref:tRNA dihydrouridine synthase DusB n=1 Tax=Thermoanaerobacterium sp. RBIITD TaxID=1550240 RepID=UPI000BB89DD5|nr:tRNA dihydrouridine synthase DusB [Thermoanaerobacterium sp. RBIITD]SNX53305.1 putative TIM-barrel protein, nifR3 family [Thermoanaerobacterium sp. RBIITD]
MKIGDIEIKNNVFLAPMAGVTDKPYRRICSDMGCGFQYTEMVSAKGLYYGSENTEFLTDIDDEENVALQIFGSDPYIMGEIAKRLNTSKAKTIDINMGCPTPKIVKNGDGSALMMHPDVAESVIKAVVKNSIKPITIKIRKGWDDDHINAVEIAKMAESCGVKAVAIHGRTREQFYSGRADWDIIKKVKDNLKIPVIGNGDIFTPEDAKRMIDETGCDAVMVGRGAEGNPWIFKRIVHYLNTGEILPEPTVSEKIDMILKHLDMMIDYKGEHVGILEMRKHIAWYLKGIRGASKIKQMVFTMSNYKEVKDLLLSVKSFT